MEKNLTQKNESKKKICKAISLSQQPLRENYEAGKQNIDRNKYC